MHGVKRERIIRVLMNTPDGSLTKYSVAKLSNCSTSWTLDFLQNITDLGYIKNTKVEKPKELLKYWASIGRKESRFDFFIQSPNDFLQNIDLAYVLTTYAAENILNHYLFPTRTDIYINKIDLLAWKKRDGHIPVGTDNFPYLNWFRTRDIGPDSFHCKQISWEGIGISAPERFHLYPLPHPV